MLLHDEVERTSLNTSADLPDGMTDGGASVSRAREQPRCSPSLVYIGFTSVRSARYMKKRRMGTGLTHLSPSPGT